MRGEPVRFSQELFDKICDRLSEGESLRSICCDSDMPSTTSVKNWLKKDHDAGNGELVAQYAHARELQADYLVDEILDIADDASNDWMERQGENNDGWEVNGEHLQRSKLRIDSRKWMAGKMAPKKYGEKLAIGGDKDMDPIQQENVGQGAAKLSALVDTLAERCRASGEPASE